MVNAKFKEMNAKIKLALKGDPQYNRKLELTLTDEGGIPEIAISRRYC